MKAKVERSTFLRFLRAIKSVADKGGKEAIIFCKEDGIYAKINDNANSYLVEATIRADKIRYYQHGWDGTKEGEQQYEHFGINVDAMIDFTEGLGPRLEIETYDLPSPKIKVDDGKLYFTLGLLDPANMRRPVKIPGLRYSSVVKVDAKWIAKTANMAAKVGDHIAMRADETGLELGIDTDACGDIIIKLGREALPECRMLDEGGYVSTELIEGRPVKYSRSLFSLDRLIPMIKGCKGSNYVTIALASDAPMRMTADFEDVSISYLLAPRIEA